MASTVLILDGQYNHHIWPSNSEVIYRFLAETSLFDLNRVRAQRGTEDFQFDFSGYDAVVLLYNPNPGANIGPLWPQSTRQKMEQYMQNGGGLAYRGQNNLYICDLSGFPTSPAANPTLTLAALAMRLADFIGAS
jgi:GMC oxidoreductase